LPCALFYVFITEERERRNLAFVVASGTAPVDNRRDIAGEDRSRKWRRGHGKKQG